MLHWSGEKRLGQTATLIGDGLLTVAGDPREYLGRAAVTLNASFERGNSLRDAETRYARTKVSWTVRWDGDVPLEVEQARLTLITPDRTYRGVVIMTSCEAAAALLQGTGALEGIDDAELPT